MKKPSAVFTEVTTDETVDYESPDVRNVTDVMKRVSEGWSIVRLRITYRRRLYGGTALVGSAKGKK